MCCAMQFDHVPLLGNTQLGAGARGPPLLWIMLALLLVAGPAAPLRVTRSLADVLGESCAGGCTDTGACMCVGGSCVKGACVCRTGWSGSHCETHDCPANCSGHGRCSILAPHHCICDRGWDGEACNRETCPTGLSAEHPCSGRGACKLGSCACVEGYAGEACEFTIRPVEAIDGCRSSRSPGCGAHGKCLADTCVCHAGWTGTSCAEEICPQGCGAHGRCLRGTCACDAGWGGADCSVDACAQTGVCSEHGLCVRGVRHATLACKMSSALVPSARAQPHDPLVFDQPSNGSPRCLSLRCLLLRPRLARRALCLVHMPKQLRSPRPLRRRHLCLSPWLAGPRLQRARVAMRARLLWPRPLRRRRVCLRAWLVPRRLLTLVVPRGLLGPRQVQ